MWKLLITAAVAAALAAYNWWPRNNKVDHPPGTVRETAAWENDKTDDANTSDNHEPSWDLTNTENKQPGKEEPQNAKIGQRDNSAEGAKPPTAVIPGSLGSAQSPQSGPTGTPGSTVSQEKKPTEEEKTGKSENNVHPENKQPEKENAGVQAPVKNPVSEKLLNEARQQIEETNHLIAQLKNNLGNKQGNAGVKALEDNLDNQKLINDARKQVEEADNLLAQLNKKPGNKQENSGVKAPEENPIDGELLNSVRKQVEEMDSLLAHLNKKPENKQPKQESSDGAPDNGKILNDVRQQLEEADRWLAQLNNLGESNINAGNKQPEQESAGNSGVTTPGQDSDNGKIPSAASQEAKPAKNLLNGLNDWLQNTVVKPEEKSDNGKILSASSQEAKPAKSFLNKFNDWVVDNVAKPEHKQTEQENTGNAGGKASVKNPDDGKTPSASSQESKAAKSLLKELNDWLHNTVVKPEQKSDNGQISSASSQEAKPAKSFLNKFNDWVVENVAKPGNSGASSQNPDNRNALSAANQEAEQARTLITQLIDWVKLNSEDKEPAKTAGKKLHAGSQENSKSAEGDSEEEEVDQLISDKGAIVHLFEWRWDDVARECEEFLGPMGFQAVQISPPTENMIVPGRPWWERYQVVSYKLESKSGTRAQLEDMLRRCNKAGVKVIAEVVFNHMTGDLKDCKGVAGTTCDTKKRDYPGVPYTWDDFHHPRCDVKNMQNATEVRVCEIFKLHDLNQSRENVQERIAKLMNELIDMGVAGFRINAAKHMYPNDLYLIYSRLKDLNVKFGLPKHTKPMIYQDIHDLGREAVSYTEYVPLGLITDVRYGSKMNDYFKHKRNALRWLQHLNKEGFMLPDLFSIVYVDNHFTERDDKNINYKDTKAYRMAISFMLAYGYGTPLILSGYRFKYYNQGPPVDLWDNTLSPQPDRRTNLCKNDWVCQHRWRQIYTMVVFNKATYGKPVTSWWDNGGSQIAFSRGDKGFVAFNLEKKPMDVTIQTDLPPGKYCDVISGYQVNGGCKPGSEVEVVKVYSGQVINFHIHTFNDDDPFCDGVFAIFDHKMSRIS